MRVFKDLDMVEQLGTGILRILKVYEREIYEFYPNFIRINFKYNNMAKEPIKEPINEITMIQKQILLLIKQNKYITQKELEEILDISRSTIKRQLKILINHQFIERIGANKNGYWKVIK